MPTPIEIRLNRAERVLHVQFDDGTQGALSAEFLRVESPSAEVQGHHPTDRKILSGKRGVTISAIEAVGNYAVKLVFDDGHDTGIYSWDILHKLVREHDTIWSIYLDNLQSRGLAR